MKIYPRHFEIQEGVEAYYVTIENTVSTGDRVILFKIRRSESKAMEFYPKHGVVFPGCKSDVCFTVYDRGIEKSRILVKMVSLKSSMFFPGSEIGDFERNYQLGAQRGGEVKKVISVTNVQGHKESGDFANMIGSVGGGSSLLTTSTMATLTSTAERAKDLLRSPSGDALSDTSSVSMPQSHCDDFKYGLNVKNTDQGPEGKSCPNFPQGLVGPTPRVSVTGLDSLEVQADSGTSGAAGPSSPLSRLAAPHAAASHKARGPHPHGFAIVHDHDQHHPTGGIPIGKKEGKVDMTECELYNLDAVAPEAVDTHQSRITDPTYNAINIKERAERAEGEREEREREEIEEGSKDGGVRDEDEVRIKQALVQVLAQLPLSQDTSMELFNHFSHLSATGHSHDPDSARSTEPVSSSGQAAAVRSNYPAEGDADFVEAREQNPSEVQPRLRYSPIGSSTVPQQPAQIPAPIPIPISRSSQPPSKAPHWDQHEAGAPCHRFHGWSRVTPLGTQPHNHSHREWRVNGVSGVMGGSCLLEVFGAEVDDTLCLAVAEQRLADAFGQRQRVAALHVRDTNVSSLRACLAPLFASSRVADYDGNASLRQHVKGDAEDGAHRSGGGGGGGYEQKVRAMQAVFLEDGLRLLSVNSCLCLSRLHAGAVNRFHHLTNLDLSSNNIADIDAPLDLPLLRTLDISNNRLGSLDYLQLLPRLTTLLAARNQVSSLKLSVNMLVALSKSLSKLDLSHNPVCDQQHYVQGVVQVLPRLRYFDGVDLRSLASGGRGGGSYSSNLAPSAARETSQQLGIRHGVGSRMRRLPELPAEAKVGNRSMSSSRSMSRSRDETATGSIPVAPSAPPAQRKAEFKRRLRAALRRSRVSYDRGGHVHGSSRLSPDAHFPSADRGHNYNHSLEEFLFRDDSDSDSLSLPASAIDVSYLKLDREAAAKSPVAPGGGGGCGGRGKGRAPQADEIKRPFNRSHHTAEQEIFDRGGNTWAMTRTGTRERAGNTEEAEVAAEEEAALQMEILRMEASLKQLYDSRCRLTQESGTTEEQERADEPPPLPSQDPATRKGSHSKPWSHSAYNDGTNPAQAPAQSSSPARSAAAAVFMRPTRSVQRRRQSYGMASLSHIEEQAQFGWRGDSSMEQNRESSRRSSDADRGYHSDSDLRRGRGASQRSALKNRLNCSYRNLGSTVDEHTFREMQESERYSIWNPRYRVPQPVFGFSKPFLHRSTAKQTEHPPLFEETVQRIRDGFMKLPSRGTFTRAQKGLTAAFYPMDYEDLEAARRQGNFSDTIGMRPLGQGSNQSRSRSRSHSPTTSTRGLRSDASISAPMVGLNIETAHQTPEGSVILSPGKQGRRPSFGAHISRQYKVDQDYPGLCGSPGVRPSSRSSSPSHLNAHSGRSRARDSLRAMSPNGFTGFAKWHPALFAEGADGDVRAAQPTRPRDETGYAESDTAADRGSRWGTSSSQAPPTQTEYAAYFASSTDGRDSSPFGPAGTISPEIELQHAAYFDQSKNHAETVPSSASAYPPPSPPPPPRSLQHFPAAAAQLEELIKADTSVEAALLGEKSSYSRERVVKGNETAAEDGPQSGGEIEHETIFPPVAQHFSNFDVSIARTVFPSIDSYDGPGLNHVPTQSTHDQQRVPPPAVRAVEEPSRSGDAAAVEVGQLGSLGERPKGQGSGKGSAIGPDTNKPTGSYYMIDESGQILRIDPKAVFYSTPSQLPRVIGEEVTTSVAPCDALPPTDPAGAAEKPGRDPLEIETKRSADLEAHDDDSQNLRLNSRIKAIEDADRRALNASSTLKPHGTQGASFTFEPHDTQGVLKTELSADDDDDDDDVSEHRADVGICPTGINNSAEQGRGDTLGQSDSHPNRNSSDGSPGLDTMSSSRHDSDSPAGSEGSCGEAAAMESYLSWLETQQKAEAVGAEFEPQADGIEGTQRQPMLQGRLELLETEESPEIDGRHPLDAMDLTVLSYSSVEEQDESETGTFSELSFGVVGAAAGAAGAEAASRYSRFPADESCTFEAVTKGADAGECSDSISRQPDSEYSDTSPSSSSNRWQQTKPELRVPGVTSDITPATKGAFRRTVHSRQDEQSGQGRTSNDMLLELQRSRVLEEIPSPQTYEATARGSGGMVSHPAEVALRPAQVSPTRRPSARSSAEDTLGALFGRSPHSSVTAVGDAANTSRHTDGHRLNQAQVNEPAGQQFVSILDTSQQYQDEAWAPHQGQEFGASRGRSYYQQEEGSFESNEESSHSIGDPDSVPGEENPNNVSTWSRGAEFETFSLMH